MEFATDEESYYPAVNTYITPETPGYTEPFNHFQRLADKLFGAVELNMDNALAQARLQKARDDAQMRQVTGQIAVLPQDVSSWLQRNSATIFSIAVLAAIFFLGSLIIKR